MYLSLDLCPVHVCIPIEVGNLDQLIGDGSKVSGLVFSAAVDTFCSLAVKDHKTHTAGSLIYRETECNKVPSKTFTSFAYNIAVNIFYFSKSTVGMQWEMDGNM